MRPKNMCAETKLSAEQLCVPIAELVRDLSQGFGRQSVHLLRRD